MDAMIRDLLSLAAQYEPTRLLAVGDAAAEILGHYHPPEPVEVRRLSGDDPLAGLESAERFDFALVAGRLEELPGARGAALLARLRDLHAQRLAVVLPERVLRDPDRGWQPRELVALGLTEYRRYETPPVRAYTFDIATYKHTPDWLNARNWAHPELWGRYRW